MSVLVVADPMASLDPQIDASVGLMDAAQRLGHQVWICTPEDLSARDGRVRARAQRITLAPRVRGGDHRWLVEPTWYAVNASTTLDVVAEVELVLLRIDPPVEGRYLHTTYLLDLVEAGGVRVVNRPEGIRAFHEKLGALLLPDLCPPTLVSTDAAELRAFVAEHGACVVKPVDGFAGLDVWLVRDDRGARALLESATRTGTRQVIAQRYLEQVDGGNKRLFLLDGEIVGAVLRRPSDDDFRIGPPCAPADVDEQDQRIAAALAPLLARHGLALAGLDVIDGRLIEVNVTCPGGMHKTDALLGTDLSGVIMRRLTHHHENTLLKEFHPCLTP
ncbi:glutathione synthase [Nocardioides marmorisolisilvae]|uniref:Glutathione synthetase n=1 Tax=Nocardioides marmorisolisilvae TaxID=1542737 RepID=A0A3N0DS35_9ACTN|nr:glutathione synthase [Nocardioides marmorisolisilvae]RNL78430.1 glutathione synthase [Nocardioides marmorisolisilvae]